LLGSASLTMLNHRVIMDYHSVGAVKRKEMPSISGSFASASSG